MGKRGFDKFKPIYGVIILVIVFAIIYFGGVWYYQSHFLPNTRFNSISIGNDSVVSAQEELTKQLNQKEIVFSEGENALGFINLEQLDVQVSATNQLNELLDHQSTFGWPLNMLRLRKQEVNDATLLTYDQTMLNGLIHTLKVDNSSRTSSQDAYIANTDDNGFQIISEVEGNQVDSTSLSQAITSNVLENETELELSNAYIKPDVYQDDENLTLLMTELDKMQNTEIVLEFNHNEVQIPKNDIASWIYMDESGNPEVDKALVEEYLLALNREYASLFQTATFNSTYSGEITIEPGTYGWYIDRFGESEAIIANLHEGGSYRREPIIGGSGYMTDSYYGDSYVEVSIPHQRMWVYINGEVAIDTPIVSGLPGTSTVPGSYQVWFKEEDSTLVGYNPNTELDYEVPVEYWIAFDDQAQGIHDASWQASFGGNAYLNGGSLGCINTPPAIMGQVFELVYVGMPVIVY
ncbi:L,D-transpeptidase family protein [Fundicoccus culcitae]|uniref:L,D-transpeptidase/peptidoglycan binding protein n=1 Tax=Fundicoccus culcitae TaxID=2969821 RepID=A0ABY5P640_9LACT|nr:L,D-transpeptidase family protein [Fundicoccus culcitae]UUX34144.1 L,D-transpeptidase/peptidoglycan binding protein [Fundicoccus culcitae]